MPITNAEKETTIRWDEEERVYWLGTANRSVAEYWKKLKMPVKVLGMTRDGEPRSWEVKLPIVRSFPWRGLLPSGRTPRNLTEEQKEVLRGRIPEMHKARRLRNKG